MFKTGVVLVITFLATVHVEAQKRTGTRSARSRAGSGYGNGTTGYTTPKASWDTTKRKNEQLHRKVVTAMPEADMETQETTTLRLQLQEVNQLIQIYP